MVEWGWGVVLCINQEKSTFAIIYPFTKALWHCHYIPFDGTSSSIDLSQVQEIG